MSLERDAKRLRVACIRLGRAIRAQVERDAAPILRSLREHFALPEWPPPPPTREQAKRRARYFEDTQ